MKKTIIIIAMTLTAVAGFCATLPFTKSLKGSGKLETVTRSVTEYNSVSAARGINVLLDPSAREIKVTADDNVIGYVVTEVRDRTLTVTISNEINSLSNCTVKVTVPDNGSLTGLSASSSAEIKHTGTLQCRDMELSASSAADIKLAIKCRNCTAKASSGADIDLKAEVTEVNIKASSGADVEMEGKADTCAVSASSGASCDMEDLVVGNCTVSASSGASAKVNCTGTLNASASSGASVKYRGKCTVISKASSGGRVKEN